MQWCSLKNPSESTSNSYKNHPYLIHVFHHKPLKIEWLALRGSPMGCQVIEFTKEDLLKDDPPQDPAVPEEEPPDEEQVGMGLGLDMSG